MKRDLANILGYAVDKFTFQEAMDYAMANPGIVITINPEMIETANKNREFSEVISNADLVIPDGIGVQIGLKILGENVRRIPGIEFGRALVSKFSNENKSIALIGAKPEVIKLTVENLQKEVENINIVYSHDGYFSDDEVILGQIQTAKPDLILVALGSPKQELFMAKLKEMLPNSLMIGLGGSFDVWAGVVDRAPKIYQNLGLEWLYRTLKEPQRLKRIFPTLPVFILKIIKERLSKNDVNR